MYIKMIREVINQNRFLCVFTAFWLAVMMFLSHQPGPDTAETSGILASLITEVIVQIFRTEISINTVHEFIRHAAHIILYMVLAVDLGILLRKAGIGWLWIVFLLMCIAVADEGTKPLIAGRHCELVDIGRNCLGNVLGIGIVFLVRNMAGVPGRTWKRG